ncbi:MAG TPA: YihY/virulence factor BrkB family protein [Planctomycetota bacterium]|nr:YihY/virulence factor BrkB family protein [Planctomycetota bacterium]
MITKEHFKRWLADARTRELAGPKSRIGRVVRFTLMAATKFHRDLCLQRASALSYATLLSLIPLTVLFFSFAVSLGGGEEIIRWVQEKGFKYLTPDFADKLTEILVQNISKEAFKAGAAGVVNVTAIVGLLLTAFGMMSTAERYMNAIWEAPSKRGYLQRLATFWVVLTVSPLFIALSIWVGEVVFSKDATSWFDDFRIRLPVLGVIMDLLTPLLIGFIGFSAFYLSMPATRVRVRSAAVGALAAAFLWEFARRSFFLYVQRQKNVTDLYGKLATFPLFLVWLYVIWTIVLLGAVIGFVHQHFEALLARDRKTAAAERRFSRAALALALLRRTYAAFRDGVAPPDTVDLAHELDAPEDAVREAAKALAVHGVLAEDGRNNARYLLATSPRTLKMERLVEWAMASEHPAEFAPAGAAGLCAPETQMCDAWRAAFDSFHGMTLEEWAEAPPSTPATAANVAQQAS